jgi:hypothetical protein
VSRAGIKQQQKEVPEGILEERDETHGLEAKQNK